MNLIKKNLIRPFHIVLIGDQVLVLLGLVSAFFLHYRILSITEVPLVAISVRGVLHFLGAMMLWRMFKMYKKVIRLFYGDDYLRLIFIVFLLNAASYSIGYFLSPKLHLAAEIYVASFFITAVYIVFSRLLISYLLMQYRNVKKGTHQKRLLIYGAGELGILLKKAIQTGYDETYNLIGFVDDDEHKIGQFIEGKKVFDANNQLQEIIIENGITDIVLACKALAPARKAKFLEQTIMFNIRVREIQSIDTIFNLNFKVDTLSLVDINDLMNREPIELFDEHVMQSLIGKTVMVTGAAGSIGSEIVRKLAQHNAPKIICVDFSESALYDLQQELKGFTTRSVFNFILADVRNENRMRAIFERFQPDEIFHAAAYKHVPLMEQYPWEAVQINVMGTSSMAKLAMEFGVEKFVFISSDKAVEPTSIMGATKRLAEIMVLSYATLQTQTQFVVTRFGNVLGSNGSVVPLFKKQIQNGGPVTVTHPDMTRYFMTIAEACQLVLEASAMAHGGEVFVFDMGEPVKIADLARNMIRLSGFIPDVEIAIKYVGQRPGEKLYENLFTPSEKMQPTHHEKIMISKQQDYSIDKAESIIRRLSVLENSFDASFYQKVIKDILPEYQITSVVENTMHEVVFKVVEPV